MARGLTGQCVGIGMPDTVIRSHRAPKRSVVRPFQTGWATCAITPRHRDSHSRTASIRWSRRRPRGRKLCRGLEQTPILVAVTAVASAVRPPTNCVNSKLGGPRSTPHSGRDRLAVSVPGDLIVVAVSLFWVDRTHRAVTPVNRYSNHYQWTATRRTTVTLSGQRTGSHRGRAHGED